MNEEEIRGKLLLPYLNDLGFNVSEVSLERSFTIRLGKLRQTIKGRADILCKRHDKNLFIIELKNDQHVISQNDIDQGISYSRALDEIAPFTIVTNGKTTKIFDTITKQDLTGKQISEASDFWKNGCTLATDVDLRIRYEALKKFVSFSDENLQAFCKNQVQERMGTIVGDLDSPSAKFVKELFVPRNDLRSVFAEFVDSEASAFAIVGSAGVGKTNAMCSLALQCLDDKFVFFYNAAIINKSPLEHIAYDLNGIFSSKSESELVLKKLDELGRFIGKKILIFIDGIDETISSALAIELSEIALAIRNLDYIKLCVSCKDSIWESVLEMNSNLTHLYEELLKFRTRAPRLNNRPGYLLDDFSDEELKEIIPIYKRAFGFRGNISDQLLTELKNGFFLRIFSEVYSNKDVPQEIDDKHLIYAYLKQSLGKTNIGIESGLRTLSEIGRILINYQYSDREAFDDEGVEIEGLLEALNFPLDKGLPEDLFARNILTKSSKEDSYHISFYYSKIRDYIISFHTYKLHRLDYTAFANIVGDFYQNYIGKSAIAFYISNASESHQQVFREFKTGKALNYVTSYNAYLDENFGTFKQLFKPGTKGEIGIVLPPDIIKHDGYALYRITPELPGKIIYEDLRNPFEGNYFESQLYKIGVQSVHGSHISLLEPDQDKLVGKQVFEQLQDIIQKGRLSAYNSEILLLEQVSLIVYYYLKDLYYDIKPVDLYLPRFDQIYPIDLSDLQYRIRRFRAVRYYRDSNVPYGSVSSLVEEALKNNIDIPKLNISGDIAPVEELSKIVAILQEKGYEKIEKHHLPLPDIAINEVRRATDENGMRDVDQMRTNQYSPEQARLYIECFFKSLESSYKDFVEYLFPTLKDGFSFYKSMPHDYFFYMKDSDILKWGSLGYRPSADGQTMFYYKEPVPWEKAFEDVQTLQAFSLDKILRSDYHSHVKTIDKINTSKVDDFCVLRNWVYKLLRNDMRELFKQNGSNI
ncbi:type I restriction enzyme HsdR N-terminal domain-containing protein [Mucilaginibacter sp. AW1-3]